MEMTGLTDTPVLRIDNRNAVFMTNNPGMHKSAKHIDVRYHYIRDMVSRKIIETEHIRSENQLADALTKPLCGIKLRRFNSEIGLSARK